MTQDVWFGIVNIAALPILLRTTFRDYAREYLPHQARRMI